MELQLFEIPVRHSDQLPEGYKGVIFNPDFV
jgi:hypothetical protein